MRIIVGVLVSFLLVLLPATSSPLAAPNREQSTEQPPNILIIVTDDQRADTMEAMPNTLRLFALRGTSFTNAYATTPLCCPSRASIMTGLYAHNHNVQTQEGAGATLDVGLTLQRHLGESGYHTGFVGKWLNGWPLAVRPPFLNEAAIFTSSKIAYRDAEWNVDGRVRKVPGYTTDFMTQRATGFIERAEADDDAPWFLMLTPPQPHAPFEPEREFADEHFSSWNAPASVGEDDKSDKPPWVETKKSERYHGRVARAKQMRTLMSVDRMIADTFDAMDKLGETGNTLAVFTSDNGFLWGEHGLRMTKRYPYTPSVMVPMYVRWPGHVGEGVIDDRFAANIDVAPTALEAAGLAERAAQLDGRSLMQPSSRQRILLEYWPGGGNPLGAWASIRTREYQYVEYYDDAGTVIYREYYDLVADPLQLENLYDNGDVLDDPEWITLSAELGQMRDCSGASCP